MRLVTIKQEFFDIFDFPTEIMSKDSNGHDRPFLMVLSLNYKNTKQSFALPFRSNIQVTPSTKGLYFSLPRRHTTKDKHAHGLHYIKIFPIDKKYCDKYIIPNKKYDLMLMNYVKKNLKEIIEGAQEYLRKYESGERFTYCTDIDRMLTALNEYELENQKIDTAEKQVAVSQEEI